MSRILVVDDDEGIVDALEAMLSSEGYEVDRSLEWEYLLSLDPNQLPDLILLDILLSGNDGRELCKILKQNDVTKHIPVILISAHPTIHNNIQAYGANSYLKKPFDMNDLLHTIKKHIN